MQLSVIEQPTTPTGHLSDELVSMLKAAKQGDSDALEALALATQHLIQSVARSVAGSDSQDFVSDSLEIVLGGQRPNNRPIFHFDHSKPIGPWLKVTLRNALVSRLRKKKVRSTVRFVDRPDDRLTEQQWIELLEGLTAPFCEADLDRIVDWPVRERIELLTLGGLHTKVPPNMWEGFLSDIENATQKKLGRPFPSEDFLMADDRATRFEIFANVLGVNRATLGKRFLRASHRLRNLQYVKDLHS